MRDHTKLAVFRMADELAEAIYTHPTGFPSSERFGLQSQMRRAAVSIAVNIVEGSARTTQNEYVRFIEIAYASSRELQYEIELCHRLGYLTDLEARMLATLCVNTSKALNGLLRALR